MNKQFQTSGYTLYKAFFSEEELTRLRTMLLDFHEKWKQEHKKFYAEKAVNSAYITKEGWLDESDRQWLFQILSSNKFIQTAETVFEDAFMFMNTQLFFNPVNSDQKNYWHRDPQYHMTIDEQKAALTGPQVNHFRIPLFDEPGIELIPSTHKRWDSADEQAVRLEENGRKNYEDLNDGLSIALQAGDLLVFSANMIHRGLYGSNRFALDVLLCDRTPELSGFIAPDCLPSDDMLASMENPSVFII